MRITSPTSTLVWAVRATCSSAYVIFSWMKVLISSSNSSLASSCGVLALMWLTCKAKWLLKRSAHQDQSIPALPLVL